MFDLESQRNANAAHSVPRGVLCLGLAMASWIALIGAVLAVNHLWRFVAG